eukprot:13881638-Alexandrium_andersonii.AAC.1
MVSRPRSNSAAAAQQQRTQRSSSGRIAARASQRTHRDAGTPKTRSAARAVRRQGSGGPALLG